MTAGTFSAATDTKEAVMCGNAEYGLTMAGLLDDPLTQLLMRSDGVTAEAHADLWERVHEIVTARFAMQPNWAEANAAP
jgi:hypothetical protein